MSVASQSSRINNFVEIWTQSAGDEKGQTHSFWLSLLQDIFGVSLPEAEIQFEARVKVGSATKFIDGYLPRTRVLVEQKKATVKLDEAGNQSDSEKLTAYQQAKRYADNLEYSRKPRWIVTCNFREFRIHDLDQQNPEADPEIITLADLPAQWQRLSFLVDPGDTFVKKEMEISFKAGELVGKLYDAMLALYDDPESPETLKSLNILCVRIVFCLYAEDAGIFGKHMMFYQFVKSYQPHQLADAMQQLFSVLATPEAERKTKNPDLLAFPYVNGGLLSNEITLEYPVFTQEVVDLLANEASAGIDWKEISPTIFGAVFESTLNPVTRRQGGMHYTSIENIHKVIDPLFLDDLKQELEAIKKTKTLTTLHKKLREFIGKIAGLKFFDPACGSGNFLTETYICLRRLENEALSIIHAGQPQLYIPVSVSIGQFYGIEINDFAVSVARTALWIAESQMYNETEDIYHQAQDYLPLKYYPNIVVGNSLKTDWTDIISQADANYILGNPPFVGYAYQINQQKEDIKFILESYPNKGKLDYVCCWYKKVADFIKDTKICAAFISTNSVTQGEQAVSFWPQIFQYGIEIFFAWKTFKWISSANDMAAVHCVVVGLRNKQSGSKYIYDLNKKIECDNINAYLMNAKDIFIEKRNNPICALPKMCNGNRPTDNGNLIIDANEYNELLKTKSPVLNYIRKFVGSHEFINNINRYCLWLEDIPINEVRKFKYIVDRIQKVKEFRLKSTKPGTRKCADTPYLFQERRQPQEIFLAIPEVSSENRDDIPIGFLAKEVIPSNKLYIITDANLYIFGILTSSAHNIWMRTVSGRLKSDYQYSAKIVYNNFPWPDTDEKQQAKISQLAQSVLDARAKYPQSSLADLYSPNLMPEDLRKAHAELDKQVKKLYGMKTNASEAEIVATLFDRYTALTQKKN